jgi:hypothetical protein
MWTDWHWNVLLSSIVGVISAIGGGLAGSLIGYHVLRLFGVSNEQRKAAFWSVIAFGLPAAAAAFAVGYSIGSGLVPPSGS